MYKELSDILRWCVRTHKEHTLVHNCFKKSGRKFSLMIIITNEKKRGEVLTPLKGNSIGVAWSALLNSSWFHLSSQSRMRWICCIGGGGTLSRDVPTGGRAGNAIIAPHTCTRQPSRVGVRHVGGDPWIRGGVGRRGVVFRIGTRSTHIYRVPVARGRVPLHWILRREGGMV